MSEKIVPHAVEMFNEGKFDRDYLVFEQREFYRGVLINIYPKDLVDLFIGSLRIERGQWNGNPNWVLISLTFPGTEKIGDPKTIGIIIDKKKMRAEAYILEISFQGFMMCEWKDNTHFNYGTVKDRSSFFSKIIEFTIDDKIHESIRTQNISFENKKSKKSSNKRKSIKERIRSLWFWWTLFLVVLILGGIVTLVVMYNKPKEEYNNFRQIDDVDYEYGYDAINVENSASDERYDNNEFDSNDEDDYGYSPLEEYENPVENSVVNTAVTTYTYPHPVPVEEKKPINIKRFSNGDMPFINWFGSGRYDVNSLSELTISNQSNLDAVVLLYAADNKVIRHSYVTKYSTYTMKQIPAVTAIMKVMQGRDWNTLKDNGDSFPNGGFEKNQSFSISTWSDSFNFIPSVYSSGTDYPTYSVTLHPVKNGNFHTNGSSVQEFFIK